MTSQTLLVGKAVLVTGGARRIGREIALELASAGADVTITYRDSRTEAEQTLQLIKQLGRLAIAARMRRALPSNPCAPPSPPPSTFVVILMCW